MEGIQFVTDDKGKKVAVLIDLERHGVRPARAARTLRRSRTALGRLRVFKTAIIASIDPIAILDNWAVSRFVPDRF